MKHEKYALTAIGMALALTMFLQAMTNSAIYALIAFSIYFILFDFRLPVHTGYFNKFVPSEIRATIGSTYNMFIQIATLIGSFLGYGLITELFGIRAAYMVCAVITLVSSLIYLKIRD
jgi:MFS family permease